MKRNLIRRLGIALSTVALASMLWGCSNMAPTGVPSESTLQTSAKDQPTGGGDSDTNTWW